MNDITKEVDNAVRNLSDFPVIRVFGETASQGLYADGIGKLLGNIAEQAVASVFHGRVMGGNQIGYDVLLANGDKLQVKSRLRTTYRQNSQFLKGDPTKYDSWVAVSFDENLNVKLAVILTSSEVEIYGSASRFTEKQLTHLSRSTG